MDLRQYDVAIARWIAIDPITHHSQSTYAAFDNNPVFWADPSGAATGFAGAVEQHTNGLAASKMGMDNEKWEYEEGDTYRNNSTGETTDDWGGAIDETKKSLGAVSSSAVARDGTGYSHSGKAPNKLDFRNSSDKSLAYDTIDWIVYINSGNAVGLSEIIDDKDTNSALRNSVNELFPVDGAFSTHKIQDNEGSIAKFGYNGGYLSGGNAFSKNEITYVSLTSIGTNFNQIEFLSEYKDKYTGKFQYPVVMYLRHIRPGKNKYGGLVSDIRSQVNYRRSCAEWQNSCLKF